MDTSLPLGPPPLQCSHPSNWVVTDRWQRFSSLLSPPDILLSLHINIFLPYPSRPHPSYWVVTDRWQRFSSLALSEASLAELAKSCDEFLVHGVDVEVRKCESVNARGQKKCIGWT